MKLPINIIARFLLKRIVVPAIGKAVEKGRIDKNDARDLVTDVVQAELMKRALR